MMTRRIVVFMGLVLMACGGWGQGAKDTHDMAGLTGLKRVETPHFNLYYKGPVSSSHRGVVEKVWEESARLLPRLRILFETGDPDAEAPGDAPGRVVRPSSVSASGRVSAAARLKEPGAGEKGFKMNLIFVGDRYDYERAAFHLLPPGLPEDLRVQARTIIKGTPTFPSQDRFSRAYWSEDPNMKGKGYDIFIAHSTASDLMQVHHGDSEIPFWMSAGFGYFMEFRLFKKSVTSYLDYEKYYSDLYEGGGGEGKLDSKDSLAIGKPWAPILKRLMKKGQVGTVQEVLSAQTATLTPARCGYMYALMAYLVSTPQAVERFGRFLVKVREEGVEDQERILIEAYGEKDAEGFQNAWHKYMLGAGFR